MYTSQEILYLKFKSYIRENVFKNVFAKCRPFRYGLHVVSAARGRYDYGQPCVTAWREAYIFVPRLHQLWKTL